MLYKREAEGDCSIGKGKITAVTTPRGPLLKKIKVIVC